MAFYDTPVRLVLSFLFSLCSALLYIMSLLLLLPTASGKTEEGKQENSRLLSSHSFSFSFIHFQVRRLLFSAQSDNQAEMNEDEWR